jgi:hypothetical protein
MEKEHARTKLLSTSDVQKFIYERRLKERHRWQGSSRSEIIKKANNPKIYKKRVSKGRKP